MRKTFIGLCLILFTSGCTLAPRDANIKRIKRISIGMDKEEALKIAGEHCYAAPDKDVYHCKGSLYSENPINYVPGIGHATFLIAGTEDYHFDVYFQDDKVKEVKRVE